MPEGLPPARPCAVDPGAECACPALYSPHALYPCDHCASRRRHARGCATLPTPGNEAKACNCRPLRPELAEFCPRRVRT